MFVNISIGILLGISALLDYRKRQVSLCILLLFAMIWIPGFLYWRFESPYSVLGGCSIGLCVIGISKITKGEIGMGDGLLLCITGIYLGFYRNLELFFSALCLAGVYSIILIAFKKANRKKDFPLIPFLLASYVGGVVFS